MQYLQICKVTCCDYVVRSVLLASFCSLLRCVQFIAPQFTVVAMRCALFAEVIFALLHCIFSLLHCDSMLWIGFGMLKFQSTAVGIGCPPPANGRVHHSPVSGFQINVHYFLPRISCTRLDMLTRPHTFIISIHHAPQYRHCLALSSHHSPICRCDHQTGSLITNPHLSTDPLQSCPCTCLPSRLPLCPMTLRSAPKLALSHLTLTLHLTPPLNPPLILSLKHLASCSPSPSLPLS